jgi:hypothetical protein
MRFGVAFFLVLVWQKGKSKDTAMAKATATAKTKYGGSSLRSE